MTLSPEERGLTEAAIRQARQSGKHVVVWNTDHGVIVVGPESTVAGVEAILEVRDVPVYPLTQEHPFLLDLLAGWSRYIDSHDPADASHHSDYVAMVCGLYQEAGSRLTDDHRNQSTLLMEFFGRLMARLGHRQDLFLGGQGGESYDRRLLRRLYAEPDHAALRAEVGEWLKGDEDDHDGRE